MTLPAEVARERNFDLERRCPLRTQQLIPQPPPTSNLPDSRAGWSETLLGAGTCTERLLQDIALVAPTDASILITGETGVGKELVARIVHQHSGRRDHPMVIVNCAAIPRELFESEFFGHVRGAFSGAARDRIGRFQLADRGTLFLDEVAELPLELQPKLLRILQDGEFQAIGDDKTRTSNVRIIAATNRDLITEMHAARFRQDLYYRLSVFPIEVPPLRERKEDLRVLARHFLAEACRRFGRSALHLNDRQLGELGNHDWPGNVRELRNVIFRAVIGAKTGELSFRFDEPSKSPAPVRAGASYDYLDDNDAKPTAILTELEMKRAERANIEAALHHSGGRIYGPNGAAELLGIKPTTLNARIKKLNLGKSP